jgi:hypothetical protein
LDVAAKVDRRGTFLLLPDHYLDRNLVYELLLRLNPTAIPVRKTTAKAITQIRCLITCRRSRTESAYAALRGPSNTTLGADSMIVESVSLLF